MLIDRIPGFAQFGEQPVAVFFDLFNLGIQRRQSFFQPIDMGKWRNGFSP
jgi:hypothetical protein